MPEIYSNNYLKTPYHDCDSVLQMGSMLQVSRTKDTARDGRTFSVERSVFENKKINFIGNTQYGYRPIPSEIDTDELEKLTEEHQQIEFSYISS